MDTRESAKQVGNSLIDCVSVSLNMDSCYVGYTCRVFIVSTDHQLSYHLKTQILKYLIGNFCF